MATNSEIRADKAFEKNLKEHVVSKKRTTLCLSVRGTQLVFSGEENSVMLAKENMEEMTVADLVEAMKAMDAVQEDLKYRTTEVVSFPPFMVKFRGRRWNIKIAREQLAIILNILGFGKGGTKQYQKAADEPAGWPDEHSFVTFTNPANANLKTASDIIESVLSYHGIDAYNHPFLGSEPSPPTERIRKRKRTAVPPVFIPRDEEEDINENDNSIGSEEEHNLVIDDSELYEEPVETPLCSHAKTKSAYELIREQNLADLEIFKKTHGILPASKI